MKTCYLILIVILLLICASSGAPAPDMTFEYSGVATYDELPATMNLAITGTQVKGTLSKPGVCESNVRLTTTSLNLNGILTGGSWEGDGSISGTWTGGDSVCGDQLTTADGYPQQGTFTITSDANTVQLLRTGAAPLPSGWSYDFQATGKVYTPSAVLPPPVLGYTITSGVNDNYLFEDKKKVYSDSDKRVYFWVQIGPVDGGEKVKIIWKDPDGNEYYTSDYVVADPAESGYESWKDYSLYSYIEIAGYDPASKPGTWSAELYYNGKYLLSDTCTITSSGSGILKGFSFVPGSPTTEDDIEFTLTVHNPPAKPSYSWDMGEAFFAGQPVAWTDVPSFSYRYSKPGTYHVTVAVRDKDNYSTILDKESWDV